MASARMEVDNERREGGGRFGAEAEGESITEPALGFCCSAVRIAGVVRLRLAGRPRQTVGTLPLQRKKK